MADTLQTKAYNTALSMLSAGGLRTPEDVERSIDAALSLLGPYHTDEVIDRNQLLRDLEASLSIFQDDSAALTDYQGHVQWLDTRRQEIDWLFSERYLRYLRERENRAPAVLDRLDRVTMKVLSHLEDPARRDSWDRRGLVVGGVQSGKTANYLGLICRAADAGYRVIVVLAGMHNNLRSQTQLRVDEGFLGFDTQKRQRSDSDRDDGAFADSSLGVGRLPGASMFPVASLTTSAEDGDFRTQKAKAQVVPLGALPVVLVVKKHAGILRKLADWVLDAAGTGDPRKVRDFPMLVLDDEADNASISTRDPFVDGQWAPEDVDPTAVNGAIRGLLNAFERKAYVGYTATPNAIIYIPHDVDHPEYGKDLFPEHFIEYVPPPSNYFGPARLFGLDDSDQGGADRTTLLRTTNDYAAWLPDKHPNGTRPGQLPQSLREAMRAFVLARAVRLARGQRRAHNSMLLHVSRFQSVQDAVKDQVRDELEDLRGRIRFGDGEGSDVRTELRGLYERDLVGTTARWSTEEPVEAVGWNEVEPLLEEAVDPIEIRLINGYAKEALAYFEHRSEGFNVIAVGGNKLSRGLTLEGLTVSYYLRAASTHDTLLQMGRWFGYRDGYEDVCRLYTTGRLVEAFRGVTEANQELINDFLVMVQQGRTPRDYGLKIQDTVPGLLVTARNKMKGAQKVRIGFSGEGPSTVALYCDRQRADRNRAALEGLTAELDRRNTPATRDSSGNWVWTDVRGSDVATQFFERYRSPAAAWKVQGDAIAQYINDRLSVGELTSWIVVLVSSSDRDARLDGVGGRKIGLVRRNPILPDRVNDGLYSIKQLLSPGHEYIDLNDEQRARALQITVEDWKRNPRKRKTEPKTPVGWAVRRVRERERGLLLVYPLEPPVPSPEIAVTVDLATDPILGFLASFPVSPGAPAVEYQVNRVYDELFGADDWDDEDNEA